MVFLGGDKARASAEAGPGNLIPKRRNWFHMLTLALTEARRLALMKQRLAGEPPPPTGPGILKTVRALRHLQLDPTAAVARSHLLVLWSRLGPYDPADLDTLQWKQRRLFEYRAFIYPIEDYPVHAWRMRHFAQGEYSWVHRIRAFMEANRDFRRRILTRLRREGPLFSRQFEGQAVTPWRPRAYSWNRGKNVSIRLMLESLEAQGVIMVAGRRDGQRLWDLTERVLPAWTPREPLSKREFSRRVAQGMLRAAGVARVAPPWWVAGRSKTWWAAALADLEQEGRAERVEIQSSGQTLPGRWYVSTDALALLERMRRGAWRPRTTLLSPFDTLINGRNRTELLFDFRFRLEIYVPKEKREYGYFVMPILHDERLIGRIAPAMMRDQARLAVEAVYAEPNAPRDRATGRAVAGAVEELARFLGARHITYSRSVPPAWNAALRS